jgi:hypothetical protein
VRSTHDDRRYRRQLEAKRPSNKWQRERSHREVRAMLSGAHTADLFTSSERRLCRVCGDLVYASRNEPAFCLSCMRVVPHV